MKPQQKTILFFDTETTGTPKNYNAPLSDSDNWPRLVQIAYILVEGDTRIKKEIIIKPDGFEIPEQAAKIHGITTEKAKSKGVDLKAFLEYFANPIKRSSMIVGHNISFDLNILAAEYIRNGFKNPIERTKEIVCTMKESTDYCAIPGRYGNKWPKLEELHQKLFGKGFDNAHNALADIEATERCYNELLKKGVIK